MFDTKITRRGFVNALNAGWLLFAGACVTGLGAFGRFMMPAVLFEPAQSFKAGFPDSYEMGVSERFKNKFGVWIVKTEDGFYVLSTVCTHLGCTPNYLQAEAKIKCPCHGSGFKESGINFEGPAPAPSSAIASCWPRTANCSSTRPASSSKSWGNGNTLRRSSTSSSN